MCSEEGGGGGDVCCVLTGTGCWTPLITGCVVSDELGGAVDEEGLLVVGRETEELEEDAFGILNSKFTDKWNGNF